MRPDFEKIVQAINYYADLNPEKKISKLHVLKIVFFADRYHLRMYGRMITQDKYFAMQYGPVASMTKNVFEFLNVSQEQKKYAALFLRPVDDHDVISIKKPDLEVFSKTDLEALDAAWSVYCKHKSKIIAFTHCFPEWKNKAKSLDTERSVEINCADFFLPAPANVEYCPADEKRLELNREHFAEFAYLM